MFCCTFVQNKRENVLLKDQYHGFMPYSVCEGHYLKPNTTRCGGWAYTDLLCVNYKMQYILCNLLSTRRYFHAHELINGRRHTTCGFDKALHHAVYM